MEQIEFTQEEIEAVSDCISESNRSSRALNSAYRKIRDAALPPSHDQTESGKTPYVDGLNRWDTSWLETAGKN